MRFIGSQKVVDIEKGVLNSAPKDLIRCLKIWEILSVSEIMVFQIKPK